MYIARDNDAAGHHAVNGCANEPADLDVRELVPVHGDFNLDLCRLGPDGLRAHLADQFVPADRMRLFADRALVPSVMPTLSTHPLSRRKEERLCRGSAVPGREKRAARRPSRAATCRRRRAA